MFGACRATLHTDFREIELASEQRVNGTKQLERKRRSEKANERAREHSSDFQIELTNFVINAVRLMRYANIIFTKCQCTA